MVARVRGTRGRVLILLLLPSLITLTLDEVTQLVSIPSQRPFSPSRTASSLHASLIIKINKLLLFPGDYAAGEVFHDPPTRAQTTVTITHQQPSPSPPLLFPSRHHQQPHSPSPLTIPVTAAPVFLASLATTRDLF